MELSLDELKQDYPICAAVIYKKRASFYKTINTNPIWKNEANYFNVERFETMINLLHLFTKKYINITNKLASTIIH